MSELWTIKLDKDFKKDVQEIMLKTEGRILKNGYKYVIQRELRKKLAILISGGEK